MIGISDKTSPQVACGRRALQERFSYEADGRRVKIADGQGALFHVYSGLDIIYEEEGATTTRHYYANCLHVAENRGGTVEYFHQDHLRSTKLKTDSKERFVYETRMHQTMVLCNI